ncbi:MAG: restriction endonuclease subunit S [Sulfurimonas denitrificans]|nr:restriction endonuclease subunit S [Sulfurimonas denitrificans]
MLNSVEWGEFNLEELFGKSTRGKRLKSADRISGTLPFVTAGETDEGISAFVGNDVDIFPENTITIDMFGSAKYRSYKYGGDDHIAVVHTENLPKFAAMFITTAIHKSSHAGQFDYSRNFYAKDADELIISLPIKNGKINFSFMEKFIAELEAEHIAELEAEHIAELEAYLLATGLKDYTLTVEEEKVLRDFENGKIKFKEFNIGELFEINSYKKRFDANKVVISEVGKPYIVRTSLNNGVRGYIIEDEAYLNDGNTISFGQDTATMFYQEEPYFTGDKIKIVKSKDDRFNKKNGLFFIATMTKSFSSFSWGSSSFNVKIIENQLISIPIQNQKPDYTIMETFISAIQKLVIKDVVLYADKKIATTKSVVEKEI